MGARGRDRRTGQALPLGWREESTPSGPGDPSGPDAPTARPGSEPGPAEDDESQPAAFPHRLTRRSRRLIAAGAVLALLVGLLIALPRLLGATTGPEHVTEEFLQAVVDGDLETVRAHMQDDADASDAALTAEVLAGAEDRLDSFEIQHVVVEAGTATVTAELRTGTESGEGIFTLTSSDTGAFSPTVWELAPVVLPELQIDLTFGVPEIEIEGVSLPVHEILMDRETYEPRVAVQLLPGTYEVSLPQVPPWVQAPQRTLEVPATLGQQRMPVHDLRLALDEDGQAEVQHQVDAALEECAASTSSAPEGCPFAVPGPEELGGGAPVAENGSWTLTRPSRIAAVPVSAFFWLVVDEGRAEFAPADEAEPIEVPFTASAIAVITHQGELEVHLDSAGEVPVDYCIDAETGAMTGAFLVDLEQEERDSECA